MKVILFKNGQEVWARDIYSKENHTSLSFIKDGTQQQIIAALEESLTQARAQQDLSYDVDRVTNISSVAGR